eukprot:9973163-Prorocentrum_lima.AAC.1
MCIRDREAQALIVDIKDWRRLFLKWDGLFAGKNTMACVERGIDGARGSAEEHNLSCLIAPVDEH